MGIGNRLALLCAAAAVVPVGAAHAQDWTGLYVGGNASSTNLDMSGSVSNTFIFAGGVNKFSFDQTMATYGGSLTYLHQVDRFVFGGEISIESGFEKPAFQCLNRKPNLGSYFGYGYECGVDYSGEVAVAVSASYLITDAVGLYVETGAAMTSLSAQFSYEDRETANGLPGTPYIYTGTIDMKDDTVGLLLGVGVRYKPGENLMIELGYSAVTYSDFDIAGTHQRTVQNPGGGSTSFSMPVNLGSADVSKSAFALGLKYKL